MKCKGSASPDRARRRCLHGTGSGAPLLAPTPLAPAAHASASPLLHQTGTRLALPGRRGLMRSAGGLQRLGGLPIPRAWAARDCSIHAAKPARAQLADLPLALTEVPAADGFRAGLVGKQPNRPTATRRLLQER